MDWQDTRYMREVRVNVVHQTNVDYTLGSLSGVQLSDLSITENYYSDTRIQAKVTTIMPYGLSDGYVDNARLRIILIIPERTWSEELMTGYVSDIAETKEHGYVKRVYSIESTIWGLLDHKLANPVIISTGAKVVDIWSKMLRKETCMQFSTEGARDYTFSSTFIYEAGSTTLATLLFEIVDGTDRMEIDGHGRLILKPYNAPSKQTPVDSIYEKDVRNLFMLPISKESAQWEVPGRVIVTATVSTRDDTGESNQEVIVGKYDSPTADPTSIASRGWLMARAESYTGSSEVPTQSELNSIAKKYWEMYRDKGLVWTGTTVYKNYHEGDVYNLVFEDLTTVKVLISSVNTSLANMTQELTMKEV